MQKKVDVHTNQMILFSSEAPGGSRALQCESHRDKVTKAETLWVLKSVDSDYIYSSISDIVPTFVSMFDCAIAKDMTLGSTKMSYVIADGLGPLFHAQMVDDLKNSKNCFSVRYDETPNAQFRNQLDIDVRY